MKKNIFKTILKLNFIFFISVLFFVINIGNVFADTKWDGRYNAVFDFKMSSASVCPKILPLDIVVEIENSNAEGYIFNNGGGNIHKFCKLYHNGTIKGKVDKNGKVKFKIKQIDSHSRQYSSYKISGKIDGTLKLSSRSSQYHPTHKFNFTKDEIVDLKKQLEKDEFWKELGVEIK